MLKTKKGFIMRKLATEYMVVAVGDAADGFNGMIQLNETGAFLWERLEKGTDVDTLVKAIMDSFESIDEVTARKDIEGFLDEVSVAIEKQ